jgi:hypothetical protein
MREVITLQNPQRKRVPNYKLGALLAERIPFTNYNATITATLENGLYEVTHWETLIWQFDTERNATGYINLNHISQTTSTLLGRILRVLPDREKSEMLERLHQTDKHNFYRVRRMLGHTW